MKRVWVCQWEIARGDGIHADKYYSFSEAVQAMRKKITECIDLEEYIADMESVAANYLRSYLLDPEFPRSKEDVPNDDDWELPDHGELALYADWIQWKYPFDAYPELNTNLVMNPNGDETCFFDFHYNYPEEAAGHGVEGMNIKIIPCMDFGTSAYPVMVLLMLQDVPQTQERLAKRILHELGTRMERKAIGKHLKLLKTLGYPVKHNADGYYLEGRQCDPEPDAKFTSTAYPLLVLQVLSEEPQTQTALLDAIQARFGVKMGRRALAGHLELLEALAFPVEKGKDGYYLAK